MDKRKIPSLEQLASEQANISDQDLDALMAGSFGSVNAPSDDADELQGGDEVEGVIIDIVDEDEVLVEFGKNTGAIPKREFHGELPELGDKVRCTFVRYDRKRELAVLNIDEVLKQIFLETARAGMVVEGPVTEINKGGLILMVKGQRSFMPLSQISLHPVADLTEFMGQVLKARITEVRHERAELVVSRRSLLEDDAVVDRRKAIERLEEGQEVDGVVRRVNEYGAFVDLGGIDGLLHSSKIRQNRNILGDGGPVEGQKLRVVISSVDKDRERVGLDVRESESAGFDLAVGSYEVGEKITALVSRVRDEGAYLLLEDGVEGFLPPTEVAKKVIKPGSLVQVEVTALEPAEKRVLLKHI